MKKSGIYQITNILNGKFYIGSAVDLNQRKGIHFYNLKNNKHGNPHLQSSYNKHGKDNFVFEIIEECVVEILLLREQYYIDILKPNYNIRLVAKSNLGLKFSAESSEKKRMASTGKKHSEETKKKMSEAHKKREPRKPVSEETKFKMSIAQKRVIRKPLSEETKRKIINTQSKPFNMIRMSDNTIKKSFNSVREASEYLGVDKAAATKGINRVLKNKKFSYKNYFWEYI